MSIKVETIEETSPVPGKCQVRSDDTGFLSFFKAWYIFPLHLICCLVFLVVMLLHVDNRTFWTGSPPSLTNRNSGLYQTEVNGAVSLVLVVVRLLTSYGSTLVIWRLVFVLLEKCGLTLKELCNMVDKKLPVLHINSFRQLLWSCFTILIAVLLWIHTVAAPLANSSLAWLPSTQASRTEKHDYSIPSSLELNKGAVAAFGYANLVSPIIMKAAFMASKDPKYALSILNNSQIPLRRYAYLTPDLPEGGTGSLNLPYFEVTGIKWVDAPSGDLDINNFDNASLLAHTPIPVDFAPIGMMSFLRTTKWTFDNKGNYTPTVFEGKRNVTVRVSYLGVSTPLPDGTFPTMNTPCPRWTQEFGELPPAKQWSYIRVEKVGKNTRWVSRYCWLVAELSIKAGLYPNRTSDAKLVGSADHVHALTSENITAGTQLPLVADDSVMPVLDLLSDVTRTIISLNLITPGGNITLDKYIAGLLTTAYQATWSALPVHISSMNESFSITPMEAVIRASVNRTRLYGWLGMNTTLSIAAALVGMIHWLATTKTKTIRDTTLAALTMELPGTAHESGLCNAAALGKNDGKQGRLMWKDKDDFEAQRMGDEDDFRRESCPRALVLVHDEK